MSTFFCEDCDLTFEDHQGLKKEYTDYIYGSCWKYIAYCQQCGNECREKLVPKQGKTKHEMFMDCGSGVCEGPSCGRYTN